MNGADAIVKCLEAEQVSVVFGYPGVAICPFYNSILESSIRTVLIRTEQNAAHGASGMARITGRPGVCAVTSGPGATNVITGIATAFADYMRDGENMEKLERLLPELRIEAPKQEEGSRVLAGLSFVVTGSLNHFASRNELKELIEERGGKVTGSVTSKTTCLINNDITSASSKNKKAKELGVPILSEEDFLKQYDIPFGVSD